MAACDHLDVNSRTGRCRWCDEPPAAHCYYCEQRRDHPPGFTCPRALDIAAEAKASGSDLAGTS